MEGSFLLSVVLSGLFCGTLLGFIMQRGRFCVTGGFRDMYLSRDNRMFYAFIIAIGVQAFGLHLLVDNQLVELVIKPFAWLSTALGSFIFGIGIIFAGGCATGTWYRAGEGLIGSWIALFGYMLMSAVMRSPLFGSFVTLIKAPHYEIGSIPQTFGISAWPFIALLALFIAWVIHREIRKPKLTLASLPAERSGLSHLLFEKRWHPFVTAGLVGLIALLAWPLSQITGRMAGLGITTPSANILQYLVTSEDRYLNWGVFLVFGIFLGSYIAAKASGEFRLRSVDTGTAIRSLSGGLLMGFGASLAGGCSIGNGLVETAMFTWQGWLALLFMIFGAWTATAFVYGKRSGKPSPSPALART